jgi:hypothetical protein
MVRHHAIGKHPTAREAFHHPHQPPEMLLFLSLEKKLPVYHPGSDMINRQIRQSAIRMVGDDQARPWHDRTLRPSKALVKQLFYYFSGK